jgi:hypothetical protein
VYSERKSVRATLGTKRVCECAVGVGGGDVFVVGMGDGECDGVWNFLFILRKERSFFYVYVYFSSFFL